MLDLLGNIDFSLNVLLWITSLSCLALSFFICLLLCVRRSYRNHLSINRLRKQAEFESALNLALKSDANVFNTHMFSVDETAIINEVLLKYFRMLAGDRVKTLRRVIKNLQIEKKIQKATESGTTGRRMEAMQILSYLDSQSSLQTIHQGLSSPNKYIRLTAARCLTRRKADIFTDDIIYFINSAFPYEEKILADILFRFGLTITNTLESYVNSDCNDCIKAACLEALGLIMPPSTSLDLDNLFEHPDEKIRVAALTLSDVTSHNSKGDILIKALGDTSIKVKIKASKIAYNTRRNDIIFPLFKLTQHPLLWVRYWSTKAIWNTGTQGKKLVNTMARGNDPAAHMAREVALESLTVDAGLAH